jgi:hypothetical protein
MEKGFSYETFCAVIGTSKQTLYNWEKLFPEFVDAKQHAFAKCQLFWERLGITHITNTHQGTRLNAQVWSLNMKNRFAWKDKIEQDVEVKETKEVTINFSSEKPSRDENHFIDGDNDNA